MKPSHVGDNSCLGSMISENYLQESAFFDTGIGKSLIDLPISLIDVGARWGVNEMFLPIARISSVIAFEPDEVEAELIASDKIAKRKWAKLKVLPMALGDVSSEKTLHILKRPNNSSIHPVDPWMAERYALDGFQETSTMKVTVQTLDEICQNQAKLEPGIPFGEVIKLDTQGSEFEILSGGGKTLSEHTSCLICEVPFFSPYDGAKNFSSIEKRVTQLGLTFFGFIDFKFRSTKRLNKVASVGRERLMQADAVFFRDKPFFLRNDKTPPDRQSTITFICSLLTGYFDYCLEILDSWEMSENEIKSLKDIVINAAQAKSTIISTELQELALKIESEPHRATVNIGKFVDDRRDNFSYHDVY